MWCDGKSEHSKSDIIFKKISELRMSRLFVEDSEDSKAKKFEGFSSKKGQNYVHKQEWHAE